MKPSQGVRRPGWARGSGPRREGRGPGRRERGRRGGQVGPPLSPALAPLPSLTHPHLWDDSGGSRTLFPFSLTLTTCVWKPLFPHITGEETESRGTPTFAPRHTAHPKQRPRGSLGPQDSLPTPPDSWLQPGRPGHAPRPARFPAQGPLARWSPRGAAPPPRFLSPPAYDSRPQYPRHALRSPPAAGQFTEHTKELTQFKGSKSR